MNNYDYKKLRPFCRFVLENFPFIEYDFDALTPWKMWCALGNEINKIIKSQNGLGEEVENLADFFENLDVQDEINNKLDEMAESGELEEIITSYLQVNGVLGFNTINNMKNATNLIDGSIVRTLGASTYNDGKGSFYKIRTITNSDTVDGYNIIALNTSQTLIAEKINQNNNKKYLFIGDSWMTGSTNEVEQNTSYVDYAMRYMGLTQGQDFFVSCRSGAGFTNVSNSFLGLLQNAVVSNQFEITDVIVMGGANDVNASEETLISAITTFINTAKTLFPNAKVTFGFIAWDRVASTRVKIATITKPAYTKGALMNGASVFNGIPYVIRDFTDQLNTTNHPKYQGMLDLGRALVECLEKGSCEVSKGLIPQNFTAEEGITISENALNLFQTNGMFELSSRVPFNISFDEPVTFNNEWIKIGKVNHEFIRGLPSGGFKFNLLANVGGNPEYTQAIEVIVNDGDWYIYNPFRAITSLSYIYVLPFTKTFSAEII